MKSAIGVYDSHDKAVEAVIQLKESGFPVKQLSIMGKAETEVVDDQLHVTPKDPIKIGGVGTGTALGATLGILTGVGLFAIPGLGFLYGAGAIVGAVAGFDIGLIGGGIASVLTTVGVKDDSLKKYHDDLEAGKFIVVAQGHEAEVNQARDILHAHDQHDDLDTH